MLITTEAKEDLDFHALIRSVVDFQIVDLHIETTANGLQVRAMKSGCMELWYRLSNRDRAIRFLQQIKAEAGMPLDASDVPSDGRIELSVAGSPVSFRVAFMPTVYGGMIMLRRTVVEASHRRLHALGMPLECEVEFNASMKKPHGLSLVSGPTGSGKTTTLYTVLSEYCSEKEKTLSIEDPVESILEHVVQCEVNRSIGIDFAPMLRHFLRQDPDRILIGEIRDPETAQLAVEASLTGHKVLSTVHTQNVIGTWTRMIQLGVDPWLFAESVDWILAQRLIPSIQGERIAAFAWLVVTETIRADAQHQITQRDESTFHSSWPSSIHLRPHLDRLVNEGRITADAALHCDRCYQCQS
jgi:general secretion pathway protein E